MKKVWQKHYNKNIKIAIKKKEDKRKMTVQELKEKVFAGEDITKEEALFLLNADLEEISKAADEIRKKY